MPRTGGFFLLIIILLLIVVIALFVVVVVLFILVLWRNESVIWWRGGEMALTLFPTLNRTNEPKESSRPGEEFIEFFLGGDDLQTTIKIIYLFFVHTRHEI